ncbi:hypothetical protein ABW19_dt0209760 [Dactylella cylindrospora]|nr:hypothetical protein ABW19_dt0209760 [Dactylella cylindrospora]
MKMGLEALPTELLRQIGRLLFEPDLALLVLCSRRLKEVFTPLLYRDLELRLLYSYRGPNRTKFMPSSLIENNSSENFQDVRSVCVLSYDHPFKSGKESDEGCVVLKTPETYYFTPVVDVVRRIPEGKLQIFEYKCADMIDMKTVWDALELQRNLTHLSLSLTTTSRSRSSTEHMPKFNVPNLRHLHLRNIYFSHDRAFTNDILASARRLVEIDFQLDDNVGSGIKEDFENNIFPQIARHQPKILRLTTVTLAPSLLDALDHLEELHLIRCDPSPCAGIGNRSLQLKILRINTAIRCLGFWKDEIFGKLKPGLEECHFIVFNNNDTAGDRVRDTIPIPPEYLLRHKDTLKYLSLFEYSLEEQFFMDAGPTCDAELEFFKQLQLKEFATALNFWCELRTPAYWAKFDMNAVDANYVHYADLEKLYVIPDMPELRDQIENDQDEFWELNPRNIFTYQMASLVLTNIAFYASKIPKIKYIIVGRGDPGSGQKVFEVSWSKHIPPRSRGAKELKTRYLFTLSPPYEMRDLVAEGVRFRCVDGTRFSHVGCDARNPTWP